MGDEKAGGKRQGDETPTASAYLTDCANRAISLLSADDMAGSLGGVGWLILPDDDSGESVLAELIADWRRLRKAAGEGAK